MSSPNFISEHTAESPRPILAALTDVLRAEARLLRELASVTARQRVALVAEDVQAVEDSIYALHRVLHTLGAARERRRTISRVVAESDDLPIVALESVLGTAMNADLRAARDEMLASASELGMSVEGTRETLRDLASRTSVSGLAGGPESEPASGN